MRTRVLHVSDLHIGRRETPETLAALRDLAERLQPELLLATGDLAHRGRRAELERAAELLRSLGLPLLAVPGNHDIPHTIPARFTRSFADWEQVFGTTQPVYRSERLVVVGLNSVRAWRQQGGALPGSRLVPLEALGTAAAGALRVVALHHHLAAPPWRAAHKRPLSRRTRALAALSAARAELVVSGHVHQAAVAERREFQVLEDGGRPALVLATASGFGRPRPHRTGEVRGVNVYDADEQTLVVSTHTWQSGEFTEVARRSFRRG